MTTNKEQLARLKAIKERIDNQTVKQGGKPYKQTASSKEIVDILAFDVSAIMYRSFYAQQPTVKAKTIEEVHTLTRLTIHNTIVTFAKYYKKYNPRRRVVLAFDRSSWRKVYMNSELAISNKKYKGNRDPSLMTEWDQTVLGIFKKAVNEFEDLIRKGTSCLCLTKDLLEADDILAAVGQFLGKQYTVRIISTDSDIAQLENVENVKVITPRTDKSHDLSEFDNDPNFYLFQKCIRGDSTDNITSAFPRVRMARLKKAYADEYEMQNLMAEKWNDHHGVEFKVRELYEENRLLIDLSNQPVPIRELMWQTLKEGLESPVNKFNMFAFLQYLGKNDLKMISERIDDYIPLLSTSGAEPIIMTEYLSS